MQTVDLFDRAVLQDHVERRAFADAIFSGHEQGRVPDDDGQCHQSVVGFQVDAPHPGGRPPHGSDVVFSKTNAHALVRDKDDLVLTGSQFDIDQSIAGVDSNRNDAAFANIGELSDRRLFNRALPSGEEEKPLLQPGCVFLVRAGLGHDANQSGDGFSLLEFEEIGDIAPL